METFFYSVKAKIRTDKVRTDGTCQVYFQIISQRNNLKLPLKGEFVKKADWDFAKGRANGKGYGNLNNTIEKKEQNIKDFVRNASCNGFNPSFEQIKEFWSGKKNRTNDLFDYIDIYLQGKDKLTPATKVHYTTLVKKLKGFKTNINLNEIDASFVLRFKKYLEKTKSGVYNMIKFLKAILKSALTDGLIINETWKKITTEKPKDRIAFLDKQSLLLFAKCNLEDRPALKETRDKFMFSVCTALRFSDVNNLKHSNIKDNVLHIIQQKTKGEVILPLSEEAMEIYERCKLVKRGEDFVFRKLTNAATNRNLKEIAEIAGIKQNISFHLSRHTFASILINNGEIDSFIVSKMMGHKKPLQTFKYTNTNVSYMKEHLSKVAFL